VIVFTQQVAKTNHSFLPFLSKKHLLEKKKQKNIIPFLFFS